MKQLMGMVSGVQINSEIVDMKADVKEEMEKQNRSTLGVVIDSKPSPLPEQDEEVDYLNSKK